MIIMGIHSKGGREKTIRSVLFIFEILVGYSSELVQKVAGYMKVNTHTHTHTHTHTCSVQKKVMG